ncbi:hypothetical protein DFH94DRAFT_713172 [Russula ochroleuca]|uniref:Uncharacterized protein n=1 Tax=Russula ochroleuca TaxID=152965 RepID=A0A9P5N516_9AGAM|nr:hypothetical protein DFH94DRAFT_713172 [Russula ochroleuca]
MRDLRDNALFSEVDLVLAEIRRFYEELNKFWTEIRCVVEALKKGRTDPRDFERWKDFNSSLNQTIEFWRNRPPSGDAQPLRNNNAFSPTGVDLGAIASSLLLTIGSLGEALERISSSASLRYSQLSRSSFQQVYIAFLGNRDLCHSFLRDCAGYGKKVLVWYLASVASPTSSCVGASHELRERTTGLWSEATGVSAENATRAQGSRRFKLVYNKALTLEQKTNSRSNTLLETLLSWAAVTDGPSDDALPDVVTLERMSEAKLAWEKARDSMRGALTILTSEPAQRMVWMHTICL